MTELYNTIKNTGRNVIMALPLFGALYTIGTPATAADASESHVSVSKRAYHSVDYPQIQRPKDLTNVLVSAEIQVRHEQYDVQGPTPFEYRVDINVCRQIENNCVPEPVLGYELRVMETPAKKQSRNDPRDDNPLMTVERPYDSPTSLNGTEIHYRGIKEASTLDNTVLLQFKEDGKHFVYTEGLVYVLGKDDKGSLARVAIPIPGLHSDEGPSFDSVNITGTAGVQWIYNAEDVSAWENYGFQVTKGGIFKPKWRKLFDPDVAALYKAGPHWGRKFGFVETPGFYRDGEQIEKLQCDQQWEIPCPAMYERFIVLGAEQERENKRKTVVRATGTSTARHVAFVHKAYAARYGNGGDATKENHGTWNVGGSMDQRYDGTVGLEDRLVDGVHIPSLGGLAAMKRVLLAPVGIDTNNDGEITKDEIEYRPARQQVKYLIFSPRGHEAEAFVAGALVGTAVGLSAGYLLWELPVTQAETPQPTPEVEQVPGAPAQFIPGNTVTVAGPQ